MFRWDELTYRPDGKIELLYRHERIFEEGLVFQGARVLDVGGWGVLAARLEQEGAACTIVDLFTEDQYYAERVRASNYLEADICDWGAVSHLAPVDVVTCFEMLEHCHAQAQAVQNMARLLCPGGVLVGTFPLPGVVHAADDPKLCYLDDHQLRGLLESFFQDVLIEPTASINKEDPPCSLYFRARK